VAWHWGEIADHDNALDMAIYGVAYEYVYARENENILDIKSLEDLETWVTLDDFKVEGYEYHPSIQYPFSV